MYKKGKKTGYRESTTVTGSAGEAPALLAAGRGLASVGCREEQDPGAGAGGKGERLALSGAQPAA